MDSNIPLNISFQDTGKGCNCPVLGNTQNVTLYHATPETGAYSHHSHIMYFEGVVFAMWSNHLTDEDAPAPKAGLAAYPPGDPDVVEKINAHLLHPGNELTWDFRELTTRPEGENGQLLCEPTPAWQLGNGTWCKLYRDPGKSFCNFASFSRDDGKTWTRPTRTNFPDANSRATAGVLPDGRVYVISNINPDGRDPLAMSLSKDGLQFGCVALIRHHAPPLRHEGRWKNAGFQYPHSAIVDGSLLVLYSVNKEDIQVTHIPLSELSAIKQQSRHSWQ